MTVLLLCLSATGVATQQNTNKEQATATAAAQAKVNAGGEKVTLIRVYRVAKWDLGRPNTPSYYPSDDVELFVVRFSREASTPGGALAPHDVSLVDAAGKPVHRNEVLWRIASGQWAEWVFVAVRGSKLKAVTINGAEFDLTGYPIGVRTSR